MKKIGFLFGFDSSFPEALVEEINSRRIPNIKGEIMKIAAVKNIEAFGYNVILDRASNESDFYGSVLKSAFLEGVKVINNPFWESVEDNFFHTIIASKLNIKVPRTAILPSKEHPPGTTSESFRNLEYPIDWDAVFDYIGFPAYLKPNKEETTHIFFKVYNPSEFFSAYDLTGSAVMLLQESVEYEEFYRVYVVGKKRVKVINYDPTKPKHLQFSQKPKPIDENFENELKNTSLKITSALGLDFNAVEFAVKDGEPYVVQFAEPIPPIEKQFLREEYFQWLVENSADFLIELAKKRKSPPSKYDWQKLLAGESPAKTKI